MATNKSSTPKPARLSEKPSNYVDNSDVGIDLKRAQRSKLLFTAMIYHGPGNQEEGRHFIGPSKCGLYDVLWLRSDWVEDVIALAWLPRGHLSGTELYKVLLAEYFSAAKKADELGKPPYNEIQTDKKAIFSPRDVRAIANQIWPARV